MVLKRLKWIICSYYLVVSFKRPISISFEKVFSSEYAENDVTMRISSPIQNCDQWLIAKRLALQQNPMKNLVTYRRYLIPSMIVLFRIRGKILVNSRRLIAYVDHFVQYIPILYKVYNFLAFTLLEKKNYFTVSLPPTKPYRTHIISLPCITKTLILNSKSTQQLDHLSSTGYTWHKCTTLDTLHIMSATY